MKGIVVCPEPPAADIGRRVLASGGNAFDAAVAAAFAQGVANPIGCGLGGLAFVQIYSARHDVGLYLNASVSIGSRPGPPSFRDELIGRSERVGRYLVHGDPNQMGYASIMTPGFVAGMGALVSRFGSGHVSWTNLVRPAAGLAEDGFEVYQYLHEYYTFEGPDRPGYPDIKRKLANDPAAAAVYMPQGTVPGIGHPLVQAEMGRTLHRIAEGGPASFYGGEIGREIGADLEARGALVGAADLHGYTVRTELPVLAPWRDLLVQTSPPPSHGAILLAMLRAAEEIDFSAYPVNSARYLDLIARITNHAFADGIDILADPAYAAVPLERLLSRERARRVRQAATTALGRGERGGGSGGSGHTTHVTAADAEGNAVAITHSIGSVAGAGVMTPGLGFLYNNFLGHFNPILGRHDSIVPGKRVGGGCPTILSRAGRPVCAIGSSGGSRLISAVFQTLLNVFVHGMDPQDAVAAPRIHCEQEGKLYVEPELPQATVADLRHMGYDITVTAYMGCNQLVQLDGASLRGGTDPRGGMGLGVA